MPEVTPPEPVPQIKEIAIDGYTFTVDLEKIDDVENIELIDKIENQSNIKAIVDFLQRLIGNEEYEKMKAYFVEKDGRFKLSKLGDIYKAIFEKFDPKG